METRENIGLGRQGILVISVFPFLLLIQENTSEETYTNLDKKLFELFQTLLQCLGSVEDMLQTPGLFRGDIGTQQVHYEVGSTHQARVLAVIAGSPPVSQN